MKERVGNMKAIWIFITIVSFCLGFTLGRYLERTCLNVAENKESLVYENSVYVKVIEGTSLESYLTAAGKKKGENK
jgi:hypothetical protein